MISLDCFLPIFVCFSFWDDKWIKLGGIWFSWWSWSSPPPPPRQCAQSTPVLRNFVLIIVSNNTRNGHTVVIDYVQLHFVGKLGGFPTQTIESKINVCVCPKYTDHIICGSCGHLLQGHRIYIILIIINFSMLKIELSLGVSFLFFFFFFCLSEVYLPPSSLSLAHSDWLFPSSAQCLPPAGIVALIAVHTHTHTHKQAEDLL